VASQKLTALTALTGANLASGDKLLAVDVSDTTMDASGTDKSMTAAELATGLARQSGLFVPQFGIVASDVTHTQSNTALSDATGLKVTIGSSATEVWLAELFVRFGGPSAQMLKVGWSFPSGATIVWGVVSPGGSNTIAGFGATASGTTPTTALVQTDTPAYGLSATTTLFAWYAWIYGGGTGGDVQFRFAQNVSTASDLKVKASSVGRFTQIAA
jgi:hypothetical protein